MSVKVVSAKLLFRSIPASLPEFTWGDDFLEAFRLLVHLLKPASVAAFLLAFWRLTSDLGWSGDFVLADGLFSHWQLWLALGFGMIATQHAIEKRL